MTVVLACDFFRHVLGLSQTPSSGADDIHVLYGTPLARVSETSGVQDKFFRLCSPRGAIFYRLSRSTRLRRLPDSARLHASPSSDSLQMYVLACHFQLAAEVAIAAAQFLKTKGPGS